MFLNSATRKLIVSLMPSNKSNAEEIYVEYSIKMPEGSLFTTEEKILGLKLSYHSINIETFFSKINLFVRIFPTINVNSVLFA